MSQAFIDQKQLQQVLIQNQFQPDEGPKAIPVLLDFTGAVDTYILDIELLQNQGRMSMVQTLFIDLSQSANSLTINVNGTGQVIIAKAHTQGYYTVLCANPCKMTFQSLAGGVVIPIQLVNAAIPGVVWSTI